jgi:hypothetical protein
MKMNDIRDELGAEFMECFTEEFAGLLDGGTGLITKVELLREIEKVREHNYEPLYLEMLFALNSLFLSKYRDGLELQQKAIGLSELELNVYEKHVSIQEGMIGHLERQPIEKAKKAKAAQAAKWEPIRQYAIGLANEGNYPSRRQAVLAIKDRVIEYAKTLGVSMKAQQAETTIAGWLKDLGYTPSASKRGTSAG